MGFIYVIDSIAHERVICCTETNCPSYTRACTSCEYKEEERESSYVGLGPVVTAVPLPLVFQQPPAATTGASVTLRLVRKSRKTVDGSPFVKMSANCDVEGT